MSEDQMTVTVEDVAKVNDWDSLVRVSHAMAVEKGWWEGDRKFQHIATNIISEAMEAWEEYRAGRMDVWIDGGGKPEGYWIEIADALIRLGDAAEFLHIEPEDIDELDDFVLVPYGVDTLPLLIARNVVSDDWAELYGIVIESAEKAGVDIWRLVRQKMLYNLTRPHRHGGKIA